jgi:phosphotriesterase-related protein
MNRRELISRLVGGGLGLAGARCTSDVVAYSDLSAPQTTLPEHAVIRTVLEDLTPDRLANGATLFHEHVSLTSRRPYQSSPPDRPSPPHFSEDLDLMVTELRAAARDGVACIVDAGGHDLGRSVRHVRTLAERSGLPIVVSGGLWTQPSYPPVIATQGEDEIAETFVRDASQERWGALGEIGSSNPMHPHERKVLRAACKAHLRTRLPLFTHTPHDGCASCGIEQLDIIESMGVRPQAVCIGHLSDIRDDRQADTPKAIAKRGAFLGFDTVGHRIGPSGALESRKVEMIVSVIDAGYEDQVLLASDFYSGEELKSTGGAGYSMVLTVFVPKLQFAGVPEATIQKILVDNPRRFLSFVPRS